MIDEGYVKFACEWTKGPAPTGISTLVEARNRLRRANLVGVYEDTGIGYGNVSQRIPGSNQFVISGTATGRIHEADENSFCIVTDWDWQQNRVSCIGPVAASSESMTHAMVYLCAPEILAVIHVHHAQLWKDLLRNGPATQGGVTYGTPEMAKEIQRLLAQSDFAKVKILAMAGHDEGILSISEDVLKDVDKIIGILRGNG